MSDRASPPHAADPWGMRKFWTTLIAAGLVAFGSSYWTSLLSQNNVLYRIDRLEQRQEQLAREYAATSQAATENQIKLALIQERQANILKELEELKGRTKK